MKQPQKRRRGRPTDFKMSERSKQMIREKKLGQKHSEETKKKIGEGVKRYHETGAPIEVIMKTDLDECGKFKDSAGYMRICIPNPIVGAETYDQKYHVALMEKKFGRKLRRGEEIHHWGEKDDNRPMMITLCWNKTEHCVLDKAKRIMDREAAMDRLTRS